MRETHLGRLSNIETGLNHSLYLHYKFYHEDLFKSFEQFAKGRLIDIGCGNKPYEHILSPYITEYIGCDIAQSDGDRVDVLCPANNIPVDDCSFDTVISTQTIEHVEDPQGLVNEAFRVLKPNGYLIISGPQYWPLHEEPFDFFRYTKYGFKYILEKAGFHVIVVNANGGKWAVAGQALIHAMFPTLFNIKGFKGKIIKFVATALGGVKTINKIFSYMDRKNPDHTNTMNYVIVAQKIQ
jgi:SAM-dependent methyltransferase